MQTSQLYLCRDCKKYFSSKGLKGKTYPVGTILQAISLYNLGYTLSQVSQRIFSKYHCRPSVQLIHNWLKEFRALCSYRRLRKAGMRLFGPSEIIHTATLFHKQVYRYRFHRAKLDLLFSEAPNTHGCQASRRFKQDGHDRLLPLQDYLVRMAQTCPRDIFVKEGPRASQLWGGFDLERVNIFKKTNYATRLAELALKASPNNKMRHDTLQKFMLTNDSVTVAVEIPIWLTPEDVEYYRNLGFKLPFTLKESLSGHIDFVQVRNGFAHILDYKPDAVKERHAHEQLTFYALALSRRAGLMVKDFRCGWFDEKDYYEFSPLSMVMKTSANTKENLDKKFSRGQIIKAETWLKR
ncbi:PD-(D/E)XK nuclease family protein [Elusimicrobiota bacterium]